MSVQGGSAKMTLSNNGNVELKNTSNGVGLSVSGNNVIIGNSKSGGPSILGNKLYDKLSSLADDLATLASIANSSMYTMHLSNQIKTIADDLNDNLENIKSSTVTIS